jgi:hypothetical protein
VTVSRDASPTPFETPNAAKPGQGQGLKPGPPFEALWVNWVNISYSLTLGLGALGHGAPGKKARRRPEV